MIAGGRRAKTRMARIRAEFRYVVIPAAILGIAALSSCGGPNKVRAQEGAAAETVSVGVAKVEAKTLERNLTLSSELVPFQQIDVYAKESGFVKELLVDYGTRVKAGQVMAVLEIPELAMQLRQDQAALQYAKDRVTTAEHELSRMKAVARVAHLEFDRLNSVATSQQGLVAQQEVDDAEGKDLAAQAQVEASEASLQAAKSDALAAQAKLEHDQVLFDYSKITAPFAGVVTQRYANLGTLVQAGTNSSTQALPLVQLSQDNLFRLVIPVPESYVHYIKDGDTVSVRVPSLDKSFPGKVARFSVDVAQDTRTMHTEVDVENKNGLLVPGLYAEATLSLEKLDKSPSVPLQAVDHEGNTTTVDVVGSDGKIQICRVNLGVQTATDAAVLSGVTPGQMVVVSDRSGLKAGQQVSPKEVQLFQYKDGAEH